jgi:membrane-associated protease RseP (regulator of RpoE activity)
MRTLPKSLGVMAASAILALGLAGAASSQTRGVSWLGVYSQEITQELRDGLDYNGDGVLIQRVVDGSPADEAGLKRGDVIVRVSDRDIASPNELASVIRSYAPGRRVRIEIVREGRHQTIEARLTTRRDSDFEFRAPTPPTPPTAPEPPAPPDVRVWRGGDRDPDADRDDVRDEDRSRRDRADADKDDDDVMRDLHGMPGMPGMRGMGAMQMLGRGRLGVRVESLNPDLASYFGSRDTRGALVIEVVDGSAAEKADLHPGDVITRVGDQRIENAEDLVKTIGNHDEGDVTLGYIRHGQRETADVRLSAAPNVMRLRRGPGEMGGTRIYRIGPNGDRRIRIRDDGNGKDDEQLRQEIQQLKKEIEQLHQELKDNGGDESNDDDEGR